MTFWLASFIWLALSALLGMAIYLLVVKSAVWLFALVVLGLILMVAKIGCSTH